MVRREPAAEEASPVPNGDRNDPVVTLPADWPDPSHWPPGHNEIEFSRMLRALRLSQGFTVFFACCNHLEQREEIVQRLVREMPGLCLRTLSFSEPIDDLLHYLRRNPPPRPVDALSLSGLEQSLGEGRTKRNAAFLKNLNLARNALPVECPYPLLFWVTDELLRRWIDGAPDFFSIRSAMFYFAMPEPVHALFQRELAWSDGHDSATLSPSERRARIEYLEGLVQEAQSHPDERRDLLLEARFLSSLAYLYYQEGDFPRAMMLYETSLTNHESILGKEHPDVAGSLNNLAELLRATGRYAEAEPLYRRALAIREQALGKEHPAVATSLNNLASLLNSTGRYAEAEPLLRRALAIAERTLGPQHPSTVTVRKNLKRFLEAKGKPETPW